MADADTIRALKDKISEIESSSEPRNGNFKGRGELVGSPLDKQTGGSDEFEIESASANEAFTRIVSLVNASDKSEKTIRDRLFSLDFDEVAIEEAIDKAKRLAIIDDARYAEVLVRSRLSQGKGLAGIYRELEQNDIDASELAFWEEAMAHPEDQELSRALELLERKPPRSKNLREGAYRKLVQKGYSSAIASSAARIWLENNHK